MLNRPIHAKYKWLSPAFFTWAKSCEFFCEKKSWTDKDTSHSLILAPNNLSADKNQSVSEIFRVLEPGKHVTLNQCCFNAGPLSTTLTQH